MTLACLRKPDRNIFVRDYLKLRPDFSRIKRILAVGIPTGIENGMFQFGKLAIQSTVSTLGTASIAAQAMTGTLESLLSNPQLGIGLGLMTIVGQCIGAGRQEEARKHIVEVTIYGQIVTILLDIFFVTMIGLITRIGGMEPEAAELTIHMVRIICIVKSVIWAAAFVPAYGLRAAGDVRFSMRVSTLSMWICRVIPAVILMRVFHTGPIGVWIGMFTDWFVRGMIFMIRFKGDKWLKHDVLKSR